MLWVILATYFLMSMVSGNNIKEGNLIITNSSFNPCDNLPEGGYIPACEEGFEYWRDLTLVASSEDFVNRISIDFASQKDMEGYSGSANVTGTGCLVEIRYDHRYRWEIFAHEFGHCLGLTHDDDGVVHEPNYYGVMDYDTISDPSQLSDIRLLKDNGIKTYDEEGI